MSFDTVSYSVKGRGWNSRLSFQPDWMLGINSVLYSWNNGDLYLHDDNAEYNNYYGVNYDSTITTIFNQDATQVKMFETICLEGDSAWKAVITTDLAAGVIESSYFIEKEGERYAHIRRDPDTIDLNALSTQGVGTLLSYTPFVMTFAFNINTSVSVGDTAHRVNAGALEEISVITAITATTITVTNPTINTPIAGDKIVVTKDSTAESVGARGYYMEVVLSNSETTEVELFSVSSRADKSSP